MSDIDREPEDDAAPELAYVTTAELIGEMLKRQGNNLLLIWEDADGLCHGTTASPLWAKEAARYVYRSLRDSIDAVRDDDDNNHDSD